MKRVENAIIDIPFAGRVALCIKVLRDKSLTPKPVQLFDDAFISTGCYDA